MKKKTGLFLFILLFTVTMALAVRYVMILDRQLRDEKVEYLESLVDQTADVIDHELTSNLDSLSAMADLIGQHDEAVEDKVSMVANSTLKDRYVRLGIADLNGLTLLSTGEQFDFSFREFMHKGLRGERSISDVLIDVFTNQEINVFATPIHNSDKEVTGVLFGTDNTSNIREMLNSSTSQVIEGNSYIIDGNGDVVIDCDCYVDETMTMNVFDFDFTKEEEAKSLQDDLSNNGTGIFEYQSRGTTKTAAYAPLNYNNWYVVVESESTLVNERMNVIMFETLFIFGMLSLLFAGIIIYTLRQQRKARQNLEHIAFTDPVTNGYNWNYMLINSEKILKDMNVIWNYYVVSLDIDKFKVINDIYGYDEGNGVICSIADILNAEMQELECFARYAADNFTLLIHCDRRELLIPRIMKIVNMIEEKNFKYSLNVSVGIYQVHDTKTNFSLMNDRANIAKKGIKNTIDVKYAFYEDMMRHQIMLEKEIENDMNYALENHEFIVYFQPKYDSSTNTIVGAEALVRWNHHSKGLIPPSEFIPLFEKNRFILKLDRYILNETCKCLAKWKEAGYELFTISVNLSRFHLANPDLGDELLEIINKHGVDQKYIELELTETVLMDESTDSIRALNMLKKKGFQLAIDDFGSGYTSLKLLKEMPADVLKIDKAFIDHIANDGKERIVVEHVASLARDLQMKVICEGVEHEEQVKILKELGCFFIQGYYYARPMAVDNFVESVFSKNKD